MSSSIHSYLASRLLEVASPATRSASQPLADWALRNVRLEGKPFSFEGHAYLKALYDETSPHVIVMKAAQVGGTTWAILRAIHACLAGLNCIYYFPTRSDAIDLSKARIRPLLEENPFLAKTITDTDTAGLKRIGNAHLYVRGLKSAVAVKSVPADLLVFDELDEASPDAKTRALERLSHSAYGRVIELSNPSLPEFGIDEAFQRSDQRHWHLRCSGCNEWSSPLLEFPRTLNADVTILREDADGTVTLVCKACAKPLDPEVGEWVATFPDRTRRGYALSQLFSSIVDPADILHDYRTTRFPERFYTLKVGIPWADRENRLQVDDVFRLCSDRDLLTRSMGPCSMGVDTGRELHVVIGCYPDTIETRPRRRIVYLGVHRSFDEVDDLMRRFSVDTCVIDGLPETHATREFAQRWPGQVFLNFFNDNQRGGPAWDKNKYVVQENRTEALDLSRREIREGVIVLPRRMPIVETFAIHLTHDAKQLVEDPETGVARYRYIKTGVNHFSLALTYEALAAARWGPPVDVPIAIS
jgi:hypothetical protein